MSERVIERVKKLLALSRSSNPHEASAAAEKARELIQKYKLDRAEVELKEEGAEVESLDYSTNVVGWQRDLGFVIARSFFCRAIHTPRGKDTGGRSWLHFVGKPEDIDTTKTLFEFLRGELKRLARTAYEDYRRRFLRFGCPGAGPKLAEPGAWKRDFWNGAVFVIDGRLHAMAMKFAASSVTARALVRVSDDAIKRKIEATFKGLRQTTMGEPIETLSGWVEGTKAGSVVPLAVEKTLPGRGS